MNVENFCDMFLKVQQQDVVAVYRQITPFFFSFLFLLLCFIVYARIPPDRDKKNSSKLTGCDVSPWLNAQVTALLSAEKLARNNIV